MAWTQFLFIVVTRKFLWNIFLCLCSYQRLLQTIAVLEAQRSQAVQDLESLGRHQREALKNPIGFVEKLQKKVYIEPFLRFTKICLGIA